MTTGLAALSIATAGAGAANLQIHLTADDLALADGATVTTWTDSVNSVNFDGTATYETNWAGSGHASLAFNGISDSLLADFGSGPTIDVGDMIMIAVGTWNSDVNAFYDYMTAATITTRARIFENGGDDIGARMGSSTRTIQSDVLVNGTPYIMAVRSSSSGQDFWISDTSGSYDFQSSQSAASGSATLPGLVLAANGGQNEFSDVNIAELMIYSGSDMEPAEINTIMGSLVAKYSGTIPEPTTIDLDNARFSSGDSQGTVIGTLSATTGGNPDPATFTLVAGTGDTDNDKFQINGSDLEVGSFDFTGAGSTHNQQFSIRVQGTGTSEPADRVFLISVTKDDDLDNLVDDWELTWAADLTTLSAVNGTENADGDTLTDLEEFQISQGLYPDTPAFPNIDPTKTDTDTDALDDDEEVNPTAPRVVTDPSNADTDLDGLSDFVETNTGTFVDANNTGSDPTLCDTDGDHARDSWEVTYSADPNNGSSHPGSVSSRVTIVPITDDASSDIDAAKTYTHAISGGNAATVNGVSFDVLSSTETPANLIWDTNGFSQNEVIQNNGDWFPTDGGVTGTEILTLLDSFAYSSTGAAPGSSQRYTLTGLTPGVNYDLRLYVRLWDTEGSSRPIDLIFTNGTQVVQPYGALPEDRPGTITGTGNDQEAYYLNFNYTAQGTELVIDATIADCNPTASGSYHLYGLTNEVSIGVSGIKITNTALTPAGQFVIAFQARPSTTYQITKSPDLATPFVALDTPLSVTTDFTGAGQAVIPAAETGDPKYFFRIE
ncbi:MAG: hypothetical protein ACON5N_13880 [Akkermansiaceae bacterium]